MSTSKHPTTRCLFCSLMCPAGVSERIRGVFEPAYVRDGDFYGGRMCYRGHTISSLIGHPKRITSARSRGNLSGSSDVCASAFSDATDAIRQAVMENTLGALIGGNRLTSDLAAGVRFFQNEMRARQVSLFVPPGDAAIGRVMMSNGCEIASLDEIPKADAILAVGDVLGTHPVLGQTLMTFREKARKPGLMAIDRAMGRTMRFAQLPIQVHNGPEGWGVLALSTAASAKASSLADGLPEQEELLERCGLDLSTVQTCVDTLKAGKHSVILVTIPPGREVQSTLSAAGAVSLAKATRSKVVPLYMYGGSVGALAVSESLGAMGLGRWLEAAQSGEFSTLFLAGADLAGHLPEAMWRTITGSVDTIITASSMPNATTERADFVLPLAYWFENDGQMMDHRGELIEMKAMKEPPGGARGLCELLSGVSVKAGGQAISPVDSDLSDIRFKLKKETTPPALPSMSHDSADGCYRLISRTEGVGLYDAGLSGNLDWPGTIEPVPAVLIHPADAEKLVVHDRSTVRLSASDGVGEFSVRVSSAVPAGTVAVESTADAGKEFFDWQIAGDVIELLGRPTEVQVLSEVTKG